MTVSPHAAVSRSGSPRRQVPFILTALLFARLLPASSAMEPPCAFIASSLASFEAIEEPTIRYTPEGERLGPDGFVNIMDLGGGTFRMINRFRPGQWWDGDRDTFNRDRQRAEVKGLGPHQLTGETFEYTTTWRTNPGIRGSARFCHIFQLKATDGDSGAPLVTLSLHPANKVSLRYWPGSASGFITAHEWTFTPATWQTVRIRVRTSTTDDGEVTVSVDGGPYVGVSRVAVHRPDATAYRPKWGLYRGASAGLDLGDDHIDHKEVTAARIADGHDHPSPCPDQVALETVALARVRTAPDEAAAWMLTKPVSPGRNFALATLAARWAETEPAAAVAWTESLTDRDGRDDAVMRAFNRWADLDASAAAQWIAQRAPDPRLDRLIWFFTTDTTLRYVNRAPALFTAPLIADPDLRAKSIDHVVMIWARQDPAEAARYVEECPGLTPEQRSALVAKIRNRAPGS